MKEIIDYFQLGANGMALVIAGWIYIAYVKNLKSQIGIKEEQLKVLEKNVNLWKDKANLMEQKTPEYIEEVLTKRIKHREEEIKRLEIDRNENTRLISLRTLDINRLREQLERTMYLGRALTYYDEERDEEIPIPEDEIEIEEMGEVFVDSASILITDPCYIDSYWDHDEVFEDIRIYKNNENNRIYRFRVDFNHYEEIPDGCTRTVNQMIKDNVFTELELKREYNYSYAGAANATLSENGYHPLKFKNGIEGAGLCVKTVYGDGGYLIYGERYKGDLVRIFIELR
ncbi:hypothetical protein C3B80_22155 [Enterobacter cloacae]|uniref:hypothetical protein n=1 Tax=Enterobacter roggenkampii TaxID=1812935 RepID=UPI0010107B7D|nr:hypothetical protein [Enterobacter roggenkampii]QAZ64983.1 hypothetical protein C3B80_22155 [Enterobacter cloacae]